VDSEEDLLEYRRRLDESAWPVEMQVMHETIESIYTHDPNGYMIELTRALRPVTPREDLDAALTVDALCEVTTGKNPSLEKLLTRKAELIVERAGDWETAQQPATATP
jgi:catechol-2,3-dioxygenase